MSGVDFDNVSEHRITGWKVPHFDKLEQAQKKKGSDLSSVPSPGGPFFTFKKKLRQTSTQKVSM